MSALIERFRCYLKRLRELQEENRRLKHMDGELRSDHRVLKEIVGRELCAPGAGRRL